MVNSVEQIDQPFSRCTFWLIMEYISVKQIFHKCPDEQGRQRNRRDTQHRKIVHKYCPPQQEHDHWRPEQQRNNGVNVSQRLKKIIAEESYRFPTHNRFSRFPG